MARTFGAVDKSTRKTRDDKGKRRKVYAGKPVVGKRKKFFERRIGNKEYIKIWIWEAKPMSYDGWKRWNRHLRSKVTKIVYYKRLVHLVHTSQINTEERLCQFMEENYWSGEFLMMGFSNAKNRFHRKPVKMCRIRIKETDKGNIARITNNYRLSRYSWFWKG